MRGAVKELERLVDRISYLKSCRRYFPESQAPGRPAWRRRIKREIRDLVRRRNNLLRR